MAHPNKITATSEASVVNPRKKLSTLVVHFANTVLRVSNTQPHSSCDQRLDQPREALPLLDTHWSGLTRWISRIKFLIG